MIKLKKLLSKIFFDKITNIDYLNKKGISMFSIKSTALMIGLAFIYCFSLLSCDDENWPVCRKVPALLTGSMTGACGINKIIYIFQNKEHNKDLCDNFCNSNCFPTHYGKLSAFNPKFCNQTAMTWTSSLCLITNCVLFSCTIAPIWKSADNCCDCTWKCPWREN